MKNLFQQNYTFSRRQILGAIGSVVLIAVFVYFQMHVFADANPAEGPLLSQQNPQNPPVEDGFFPEWIVNAWEILKAAISRVGDMIARVW